MCLALIFHLKDERLNMDCLSVQTAKQAFIANLSHPSLERL